MENCSENESSTNSHCGCADGYALSPDRASCVSKASESCPRTLVLDDRVPRGETCISNATCDQKHYKLAQDKKLCVTSCSLWIKNDSGELQCVEKCPDWWFTENDGLCEDDEWMLGLAIALPLVFGVAAAVVAVLCAKKRKTLKTRTRLWQDISEEMRDQLTRPDDAENPDNPDPESLME